MSKASKGNGNVNGVCVRIRADGIRQTGEKEFEIQLGYGSITPEYAAMLAELFPNTLEKAYHLLNIENVIASIIE